MKRRDFLTKGTVAAGLAGSARLLPPLPAAQSGAAKAARAPEENRSSEYLQRARQSKFLPKPPAVREVKGAAGVPISPMPLEERLKRNIVPRRGLCSTEPGHTVSQGLTTGNGAMNIEVMCDPYAE